MFESYARSNETEGHLIKGYNITVLIKDRVPKALWVDLYGVSVNNPTGRAALSWRAAQPLALSDALPVGLCM